MATRSRFCASSTARAVGPSAFENALHAPFGNFIAAGDRADDLLSASVVSEAGADRVEGESGTFDQKIEAMPDDHANSLDIRETNVDRASLRRFQES
jgi:hypothetical protein